MKNIICLLLIVFTATISFGQAKKKESKKKTSKESGVYFKCDSLSKVYKVHVVSYGSTFECGKWKHSIFYNQGTELKEKEIPNKVR